MTAAAAQPVLARIAGAMIRRELDTLRRELQAYEDERDLWATPAGIANSAGTLTLHVVGNLRHFLGAQLGGTSYVRHRAAEFSDRDVPVSDLLDLVDAADADVARAMSRVTAEQLDAPYPLELGGVRLRTYDFLVHLCTHLTYHLGQIDYHRRIVTGVATTAGAVGLDQLATASPAESS